jgi:hypothetical protein
MEELVRKATIGTMGPLIHKHNFQYFEPDKVPTNISISIMKNETVPGQSDLEETKRYLKSLAISKFRGDDAGLGEVMKKMHLLVEEGKAYSEEADNCLEKIANIRMQRDKDEGSYIEKIKKDRVAFLKARKRAIDTKKEPVSSLTDDEFWGTRQQLRSGKVVGDMLGGLDPVFGVLLNPTGNHLTDTHHTPMCHFCLFYQ